jgi:hypothetical protein
MHVLFFPIATPWMPPVEAVVTSRALDGAPGTGRARAS